MNNQFLTGDLVTWASKSHGFTKTKTGTVVAVVQPGQTPQQALDACSPAWRDLYRIENIRRAGTARSTISYVVAVTTGTKAGNSPMLYWPDTNKLGIPFPASAPEQAAA